MKTSTLLVIAVFLTVACATAAASDTVVYDGMLGPEDMVLDLYHGEPRLLVSSSDRSLGAAPGEIYALSTVTGDVAALPRKGEPEGLAFNPHGLDLVGNPADGVSLYVITHWIENDIEHHAVLRYSVTDDHLHFERLYESDLLVSPNDLSALPDGTMYVSNDSSGAGGMLELILSLKRSTVVYYDGTEWTVAAERIAMANGIVALPDRVYVAATRENRIYEYRRDAGGLLTGKRVLARVKGPDNMSVSGASLIVASHAKSIALARHLSAEGSRPLSPTNIYRIDPTTGSRTSLFSDTGKAISAASVGVEQGRLYIGQIMEPFVLSVPLD